MTILDEILKERSYQDTKWGKEFDDKNSPFHWAAYITQYATRHLIGDPALLQEIQFREDMIKVAALAIAAIESHDRRML